MSPAILAFLRRHALLEQGQTPQLTPLSGGVSADIWLVQTAHATLVVKQALARLRVQEEWLAPVSRNAAEVAWLQTVASIAPANVPPVLAHDAELGVFAMPYLAPEQYTLWKSALLRGEVDLALVQRLGQLLGSIHAATAARTELRQTFANDALFAQLRMAPYFEATARHHPNLAEALHGLVRNTLNTHLALVHGDVSPKNILVRNAQPVLLDAECAWYGDPAFDVAFCLNHLLLKCLVRPLQRKLLLAAFDALCAAYLPWVNWEDAAALEQRTARLLPGLMLARVDGKSPVEYLTQDWQRQVLRQVASKFLLEPSRTLQAIRADWDAALLQHDQNQDQPHDQQPPMQASPQGLAA